MFAQPKLTICVPSRNRQRYFQETIRSLLMNLRTDVEYVFADNSDDASIMNDFMEDVLADPRVKYLPSGDRVLSDGRKLGSLRRGRHRRIHLHDRRRRLCRRRMSST